MLELFWSNDGVCYDLYDKGKILPGLLVYILYGKLELILLGEIPRPMFE
jgi:hypothetical protein